MVALVVPIEVSVADAPQDDDLRGSGNSTDFDALQTPVMDGSREVNRSRQPSEAEKRKHERTHLPHAPWCAICCRARTIDDPQPPEIRDERTDALLTVECDYAEMKMKGDTTPMRVLLLFDSSTGYLGATDVDQTGGGSGFCCGWVPLATHE